MSTHTVPNAPQLAPGESGSEEADPEESDSSSHADDPKSAPDDDSPSPEEAPSRIEELSHPAIVAGIRTVLNRYELSTDGELPKVIAVVAALRGEGVTAISNVLAEVLTVDFDATVCLVDMSWGMTGRSRSKKSGAPPGLLDVVRGSAELEDVVIRPPSNPQLRFVPAGSPTGQNPASVLRAPRLEEVLEELRQAHDFVVLDTPPVLAGPEGVAVVRHADAHLLVVRWGGTTSTQVAATEEELRSIPALGAILNDHRSKTPKFVRRLLGG